MARLPALFCCVIFSELCSLCGRRLISRRIPQTLTFTFLTRERLFFPLHRNFNFFKIQDVPKGHAKDYLQEQGKLTDEEYPLPFNSNVFCLTGGTGYIASGLGHMHPRVLVMGSMFVTPQNPYVETPTPRVMVFEDGAFGR